MMIDVRPFLLRLSIISIASYIFRLLRKVTCMALLIAPPPPSTSPWYSTPRDQQASNKLHNNTPYYHDNQQICIDREDGQKGVMEIISPGNKKNPGKDNDDERVIKPSKKRPARLVIPPVANYYEGLDHHEVKVKKLDHVMKEFEAIKGKEYSVVSKKGRRETMEDRHGVILDILGDPKQAFFVVIDGHGGHEAADYVARNLGKNVINELKGLHEKAENHTEAALGRGYSATDKEFLARELCGGACAASVFLKDGMLHAANIGDCRVVLSRKGEAIALTSDHRLSREDERARIENSGGFVHCHNGTWRVNGTLAVSRAFGDLHLKDWIICEPEIAKIPLTSDCEFLILASDGLWDKVSDQEAVDHVASSSGGGNFIESCRKLVELSSSRGNRDDITVMIINIQSFKINVQNSTTNL